MKKVCLTLVTIFVSLLVLSSGCVIDNNKAVKDTVTSFFNAYQNREFSRCLDLFSERLRDSRGDNNLVNEMQSDRFWAGNVKLRSMGEPTFEGKKASIWVDYETLFGVVNTIQFTLVKEGSMWKIDDY